MLAACTARHQSGLLQKLLDEDIVQAAAALAATLETADRGIVYEHQPASQPAARLMTELKVVVDEMSKNAGSALDRDAAIALRRIENAARVMAAAGASAPSGASASQGSNEFQRLLSRVLAPEPAPSPIIP